MTRFPPLRLGWLRDLPDPRDLTPEDQGVRAALKPLKPHRAGRAGPAAKVDWREFCPEVDDQGGLASCPAQACLGLAAYFERRTTGRLVRGSPRFLYKMARGLSHREGDCGAGLRVTLKAMVRFGVPPEEYWPSDVEKFDEPPAPFLFSFADPFREMTYLRLDARGDGARTLKVLKAHLAAGFACVFGFPVFSTVTADPDVPSPTIFDSLRGGQSAVAVGYDDGRRIRSTKGALLIRNSWGPSWGEGGYGWLPYAYVEEQLAADFWTLLRPDWLASGELERPAEPRAAIGLADGSAPR